LVKLMLGWSGDSIVSTKYYDTLCPAQVGNNSKVTSYTVWFRDRDGWGDKSIFDRDSEVGRMSPSP
jgi:hypothetical protein